MPTGLAILAGLGQGLGKFPEGLLSGLKLDAEERRLQAEARQREAAERQATETLGLGRERLGIQREQLAETTRARTESFAETMRANQAREALARAGLVLKEQPLPFTLGEAQQRFDPTGKVIATGLPKAPKEADSSKRREGRIAEALRQEGWAPGDPGYERAFIGLDYPPIPVEGRGPFERGHVIPPGPRHPSQQGARPPSVQGPPTGIRQPGEPLIPVDRPIGGETQRQLGSGRILEAAVSRLEAALKMPGIEQYLGPVSQYRSSKERIGAELGKLVPQLRTGGGPPPAVVALEQNLRILSTETRRLATGAQMSAAEIEDILGQLPRQDRHQLPEFLQRLETAKRNIQILRQMGEGSLTDQQRARMRSLLLPGPQSPAQSGWKIERVE